MPFPLLWKINFLSLVPQLLELKPVMHSIQLVAFLIFEVSLINRTHASPTLNFGQTSEMTIGLLDYSLSLSLSVATCTSFCVSPSQWRSIVRSLDIGVVEREGVHRRVR
jgi:hypothetical protein